MTLTFASKPETDDAVRPFLERFSRKLDLAGLGPSLARSGALEARLAETKKDVRRAQKLRYRVFFEEGGAIPDPTARLIRRDVCRFDRVADHLIVVDRSVRHRDGAPRVVGVYRLLRLAADEHGERPSILPARDQPAVVRTADAERVMSLGITLGLPVVSHAARESSAFARCGKRKIRQQSGRHRLHGTGPTMSSA